MLSYGGTRVKPTRPGPRPHPGKAAVNPLRGRSANVQLGVRMLGGGTRAAPVASPSLRGSVFSVSGERTLLVSRFSPTLPQRFFMQLVLPTKIDMKAVATLTWEPGRGPALTTHS